MLISPSWAQTIVGRSSPASASAERVGPHAVVVVERDGLERGLAEPEQPHGPGQGDVVQLAGQHPDGRRTDQAVALDVPAPIGQHAVAGRGEAGDVGHLAAGDHGDRRGRRQVQRLEHPGRGDLLEHRRGRASGEEPGVLIPGGRQEVGRDGGRQRAADDEAVVAGRAGGDDAALGRSQELGDDVGRRAGRRRAASSGPG